MRWIALLYGKVRPSLAATSGVHRATDALKMLIDDLLDLAAGKVEGLEGGEEGVGLSVQL